MVDQGTRPRWRDALFVTAIAIVLVAGLIHYGTQMSDEPVANPDDETSQAPRAQATAELGSAPTADPTTQPVEKSTCWDGRPTASLMLCGLPDGARGLTWVFPSFSLDNLSCHKARRAPAYAVVASFECFERVMGRPVTITYDQVADVRQVESWFERSFGLGHRIEMPGAHGGRCVFKDGAGRPARISGMYERFPYVVSVFAPDRKVAERAWQTLVRQRSPQSLRGVRGA
jgi:hypothetical protein